LLQPIESLGAGSRHHHYIRSEIGSQGSGAASFVRVGKGKLSRLVHTICP